MNGTNKKLVGAVAGMGIVVALLVGMMLGRSGASSVQDVTPQPASAVAPAATVAPSIAPDTSEETDNPGGSTSVSSVNQTSGADLQSGDSTSTNSVDVRSEGDGGDQGSGSEFV